VRIRKARGLYRILVVGAVTLAAAGAAVIPAAASGPAAHSDIAAASRRAAPLVTDARPARSTKAGLAAPAMTTAMQAANASKQAHILALLQLKARTLGPRPKCTTLACRAGLPAAHDLAATQQPQVRGYYCGPATVAEMLAQVGVKISQSVAARQLGTNLSGTNWSDASGYPVPRVLNHDQRRNAYVAVALPWTPTARQISVYETDLVADIKFNGGAPLAGNAYEVAGGPHLVGNPVNQTIMHWFDIRGYKNFGAITDYEDSVHGATSIGWSLGVPAYSSMPSGTIADILGARGYDW
jgi:hypothetical protein